MIFTDVVKAAFAGATLAGFASAIELDIHDEQSIKDAAAIAASDTMSNYTGNIPGKIPDVAWWVGGALSDIMIQYWYFTGDDSNNPAIRQGMYHQRGDRNDFLPANFTFHLGNDDQSVWGLAAMTAAELGFSQDPSMPSWYTLAENVFNSQIQRWDTNNCDGGLRWQFYPYEKGYDVKDSGSNGQLFQLAARLGRYTDNKTYTEWAEKIWDWSADTALIDTDNWVISNAVSVQSDCETRSSIPWSINYGAYLGGVAYMYNITNDQQPKWQPRLDGLLNKTYGLFFPEVFGGMIMSETICEVQSICSPAQDAYKGILAGDLVSVVTMAPYTTSDIVPRLQKSALGAAKQCSGGSNDTLCGQHWSMSDWDGNSNIQTEMSATSIFSSNLVVYSDGNVGTEDTPANSSTTSASGTATGTTTNFATSTTTASPSSTGKEDAGSALGGGPIGISAGIVAGIVAVVQAIT